MQETIPAVGTGTEGAAEGGGRAEQGCALAAGSCQTGSGIFVKPW